MGNGHEFTTYVVLETICGVGEEESLAEPAAGLYGLLDFTIGN